MGISLSSGRKGGISLPDRLTFDRKLFLRTALYTLLFQWCAHGYRYFNTDFSHDSTNLVLRFDAAFQITLGRFLVPVHGLFRGDLVMPFLCGLFGSLFLIPAVYLILRELHIRSHAGIIAACALLAVNETMTATHVSYIACVDAYMIGLLFAALGVRLLHMRRFSLPLSILCIALSIGAYQSYLQFAVMLAMLSVLRRLLDGETAAPAFAAGVKSVAALVLGLILYAVMLSVIHKLTGLTTSSGYNGLSGVGEYDGVSIPALVADTWLMPLRIFLNPVTHKPRLALLIHLSLAALFAVGMVVQLRRLRPACAALALLLLAAMPFGANCVNVISKGMTHSLMTLSYQLFFLLFIMVFDRCALQADVFSGKLMVKAAAAARKIAYCGMFVLVFLSAVYANQSYLKRSLEYKTQDALFTRLFDRIEQVEGYEPGKTPVAFAGFFSGDSSMNMSRPGFAHLSQLYCGDNNFPATYWMTYGFVFDFISNYPLNIISDRDTAVLKMREDVIHMPSFPEPGCCRMVDGVLVAKLSPYRVPTQEDLDRY